MTDNETGLASIARAFATYSLVPYLGILFCPGAVVVGGLGVVRSYRKSETENRTTCYICASTGFVVLVIQCLLWWILYKVPEWAKGL
jgi:hypothetical protein